LGPDFPANREFAGNFSGIRPLALNQALNPRALSEAYRKIPYAR